MSVVKFKTAELANQNGFIGDRVYAHTTKHPKANYYTLAGDLNGDVLIKNSEERVKLDRWFYPTFPAPNQEELKLWFMTEHQIHVRVDVDATAEPKFYYKIDKFFGNPKDLTESEWGWEGPIQSELYADYHDAFEDGLVKCFELLKKD